MVAGTGATSVAYKHNALGERVSRVEGGTTTHFHYDLDGTLIAESDGTGVVIREYLWLGTKPVGLVVGPAGSPTLYFVHADHLDRAQKITDGTQAIVWDGQFTPYGRTHAITGTVTNPLRFPGQWADPAAGYFYNYMRDYDPTLARYLSVDPLGTGGGRNKFSYAGANPQNMIDPTGRSSWFNTAALFGAISVAIDAVVHSAFGDRCTPYTLGRALGAFAEGALLGVGFRAFGLALRGLGLSGAGAAGPGAGLGAGVAGRGASGASSGLLVASGQGAVKPAQLIRQIEHGEKISNIVKEAATRTYQTGNEVALLSLRGGQRILVEGGPGGISNLEALAVRRILGHTHPMSARGAAEMFASGADKAALRALGQTKSYINVRGVTNLFRP